MYSAQGHVAITRKEPSTAGVRVQEQRGLTAGGGSSRTEAGQKTSYKAESVSAPLSNDYIQFP